VTPKVGRAQLIDVVPWSVALVGLAVPGFAGGSATWLVVALWLLVLAAIALARPLRSADRPTRLKVGVAAVVALVLLATLWGLYLIPAVTAWLAIVMW
jgi:hypothetical protein